MIDLKNMNPVTREAVFLCYPLAYQISAEIKSQEWEGWTDPKGARLARLKETHPELAQCALDAYRRLLTENPKDKELQQAFREAIDNAAIAMAQDEIQDPAQKGNQS